MRLIKNTDFNLVKFLNNQISEYPVFLNLNFSFGFGFLLGLCLIIQIFTGFFLSMHYVPHIDLAFNSIEHIMRDISYGWLIRYIHSNTASFFFICIYIHIGRGILYKSYNNIFMWITGISLFLLLMLISFLGYILPWGQMSYWGAVVITNLISVIPFFGKSIVVWLWGGFSISNPTLNRFFILHYLLPFLLLGISWLHILFLHSIGSKNPINVESWNCITTFNPYFLIKDIFGLLCLINIALIFIFFYPEFLGHSDNAIKANILLTPLHIVPEWYFLPFYAILRVIPHKGLGILLLLTSILILLTLTFIPNSDWMYRSDYIYYLSCLKFILSFFKLMWLGSQTIIPSYVCITCITLLLYFSFFFIIPLHLVLTLKKL